MDMNCKYNQGRIIKLKKSDLLGCFRCVGVDGLATAQTKFAPLNAFPFRSPLGPCKLKRDRSTLYDRASFVSDNPFQINLTACQQQKRPRYIEVFSISFLFCGS